MQILQPQISSSFMMFTRKSAQSFSWSAVSWSQLYPGLLSFNSFHCTVINAQQKLFPLGSKATTIVNFFSKDCWMFFEFALKERFPHRSSKTWLLHRTDFCRDACILSQWIPNNLSNILKTSASFPGVWVHLLLSTCFLHLVFQTL